MIVGGRVTAKGSFKHVQISESTRMPLHGKSQSGHELSPVDKATFYPPTGNVLCFLLVPLAHVASLALVDSPSNKQVTNPVSLSTSTIVGE